MPLPPPTLKPSTPPLHRSPPPSSRRASYSRSILPSFVSRGSRFIRCIATASSSAEMPASVEQVVAHSEPVVSADWLHANLRAPDVKRRIAVKRFNRSAWPDPR